MRDIYRREEITWIDSGFSLLANVWQTSRDIIDIIKEDKIVTTIGYNVYENENWVVLVQSINTPTFNLEEDLFRGGYLIYKPCIKNRKDIKE